MKIASHVIGAKQGRFPLTRWSLIAKARSGEVLERRGALEVLCGDYWVPIYVFIRRKGYSAHDAEDLTQAFFGKLIEKDHLVHADDERGKLRTFLLAILERFLKDERQYAQALKRGGGVRPLSIDVALAEGGVAELASPDESPARHYERQWAIAVMRRALEATECSYRGAGQERAFDLLKGYLLRGVGDRPHSEVAQVLGISVGSVKVAIHRLRGRYQADLFRTVLDTVSSHGEANEELRHMASIFASGGKAVTDDS